MDAAFTRRGFLPEPDPLARFGDDSEFAPLDELGRDLPSLLQDPGFRAFARGARIPPLPDRRSAARRVLRLYYVRLGFLASAYVNQVGQEPATVLPRNIAVPLCDACRRLGRPPILSYDGYALYNWKRFDPAGPIALGNIDTIQNFVHLYDEHWFILVHVEIEALAAGILAAIDRCEQALAARRPGAIDDARSPRSPTAVWEQVAVLRRIPEKMDPALYYKTFRPYIRFFEGVVYEGVDAAPMDFRGETGAQSSVDADARGLPEDPAPAVAADQPPGRHAAVHAGRAPGADRARSRRCPTCEALVDKAPFNEALEALATFREVHLGCARSTSPAGSPTRGAPAGRRTWSGSAS